MTEYKKAAGNQKDEKGWVLVVEDNLPIRSAYSSKLVYEGIAAQMVGDGEEALQILKGTNRPSLVLLDLVLPKRDGFEILKEMKKDPQLSDIPVLILTNLAQEAEAKRGIELGAKEYLVKANTDIEDLIGKIRQYLPE